MNLDAHAAWASLKHGGLLLAPNRLADVFPGTLDPLHSRTIERLRRSVTEHLAGAGSLPALLDTVLEDVVGLGQPLRADTGTWLKASSVGAEWSRRALAGESVKPQRLWHDRHGARLPVFVDREARIGVGRGRRMPARVVEWLRATSLPLALLTNGRQWRLIHASQDAEAFAEWDIGLWFEAGEPSPQVAALRALLRRANLVPTQPDTPAPLAAAIQASRKGQAELSAILGERVREAVELLIRATLHDGNLPHELGTDGESCTAIYRAATRVVMRLVVVLFAESRAQLLPRDIEVYQQSYGLLDLREALQHAGAATPTGLARLAHRHVAWPRVLSLFRILYRGSAHAKLPIPRYGGGLFAPADTDAPDAMNRALAVFENPSRSPTDADVYRILERLCVTETRIKQGQTWKRVPIPVDFSDLSSEYIGILYEGLLDYELRRVEANDPVVFLNLGDQPALPLARLEAMPDKALADLVEKLKVKKKIAGGDGEDEDEDTDVEDGGDEADDDVGDPDAADVDEDVVVEGTSDEEAGSDARRDAEAKARAWARRAVDAGKLVAKPKSKTKDALASHAEEVDAKSRQLIARIVLPGEWYLVRWGGTRKGAGTFYTRPQLAVPTVRRTLEPLCFAAEQGASAEASSLVPRTPEAILALKVCDPAMGSGSFLVAALRYLTEVLHQSLYAHGRIAAQGERTLVTLAEGRPGSDRLDEETLPCRPDDEDFDDRLRAILKRYVVERCLYGVDLDPLAVDLARLALWVETLDRDLPFEFLDHKLKVGNALVGCWFDRFRDYPAMAWEREGGDKNHANGVHCAAEAWTKAIKQVRNGVVKRELAERIVGQLTFHDHLGGVSPEAVHDEAVAALDAIHAGKITDAEERERRYRQLESTPTLRSLRMAFDTWCAIWFWPADRISDAPTPRNYDRLSSEQLRIVAALRDELRFFHWELEFPDVFRGDQPSSLPLAESSRSFAGFDAILGNPPWEIQKPSSKEFFSNIDPLYRTYGKQQALLVQRELFDRSAADERAWLAYSARFKALSNWNKHVAAPFGDPRDGDGFSLSRSPKQNDGWHTTWRERRSGRLSYADARHPFRHQGSADLNTYKTFLEVGHALLADGGQLGLIVPSGLYTDKGTTDLRRLFLEECQWQWLFGFENRAKIFDIDSRFKFCMVILGKGRGAERVRCAFMRHDLSDWESPAPRFFDYPRTLLDTLSPKSLAFLEVDSPDGLMLLSKLASNAIGFGDESHESYGIHYSREFHMGDDAGRFRPVDFFRSAGFEESELGVWRSSTTSAWPFLEGRCIDQFQCFAKHWMSGKGRGAVWRKAPPGEPATGVQYLMEEGQFINSGQFRRGMKIGVMDVTAATNERTVVATLLPECPTGHSVMTIQLGAGRTFQDMIVLVAVLNSFAFDYAVRQRLGGNHLSGFVVEDAPLVRRSPELLHLLTVVLRLCCIHPLLDPIWARAIICGEVSSASRLRRAVTAAERLRLRCISDAVVPLLYGLNEYDLRVLLSDTDQPARNLRSAQDDRKLDPKGFWRVDKDKDPELRHTVLAQVAFQDLQRLIADCGGDRERAIELFCGLEGRKESPNSPHVPPSSPLVPADGWQLPETLCLADYGLGHDERAKQPQPVASRLGPRFYDWQLQQTPEESWRECEIHARNILGEEGFAKLQAETAAEKHAVDTPASQVAEAATNYASSGQPGLFDRLPPGARGSGRMG